MDSEAPTSVTVDSTEEPHRAAPTERRRHRLSPSRGEQRREQLLDSAEELLATSSAADLTIEEVASAAGLSRSSMYFYFANKTALIDALIVRASDEMLENTVARVYGEPLDIFIERVVRSALAGWRRHPAVFLTAAEVSSHANEGTSRWRAIMSAFADRIAEAVRYDLESPSESLAERLTLYSELACWAIERNFYMLFAREHEEQEEAALADALIRSVLSMLSSIHLPEDDQLPDGAPPGRA